MITEKLEEGRKENPFWGNKHAKYQQCWDVSKHSPAGSARAETDCPFCPNQHYSSSERKPCRAVRPPFTPCAFQQLQPAAALCTLEALTPPVVSLHFSSSVTIRIRWLISLETCSPLKEMGPSFLLRNVYYP